MPVAGQSLFGGRKKKIVIKPLVGSSPRQPSPQFQPSAAVKVATAKAKLMDNPPKPPVMPSTGLADILKEHDEKAKRGKMEQNLPEANNVFTQEELTKYWVDYAESLDVKDVYLRNTMLDCKPVLRQDAELLVLVNHDKQEQELKAHSDGIVQYLYETLHNSHIKIRTAVKEKEKVKEESIYTAQEKYDYLRKKNPRIEELMEKLDLKIE